MPLEAERVREQFLPVCSHKRVPKERRVDLTPPGAERPDSNTCWNSASKKMDYDLWRAMKWS